MNNPFNVAIIIIRVFGCIFIFLGLGGVVFVALFFFFHFLGAPEWFFQNIAAYAVESMISSPILIIIGVAIIIYSQDLANFIIKPCESDEISS